MAVVLRIETMDERDPTGQAVLTTHTVVAHTAGEAFGVKVADPREGATFRVTVLAQDVRVAL